MAQRYGSPLSARRSLCGAKTRNRPVELLKVERTIELGQLTQVTCSYAWPICVQKAARKDADPDIPILKEAKAEYAKLQ
jgi:hypothetical protein